MRWQPDGPYAIRSEEGYRISKALVEGEARYTAWSPQGERIGGVQTNAEAARVICERHAEGT